MNKTLIATIAGALLIGTAAYGGYRIGLSRGTAFAQVTTSAANVAGLKAGDIDPQSGKKVLYWHDPMVPGQRFDKPGKSPFMDMQLVPVYADGDAGGGGVTIDSRIAQNLGIRTAEVQSGHLGSVLDAPGNVAVDERSVQVIQARTSAFVQQVSVRAMLDPVRRGQALVSLYSPDWVAAQEEYLALVQASRQTAHGQSDLAGAAKARMLQAGMTPGQISAVSASGKLQPALAITSPIDGFVTEIAVRDGMTVSPGMTLFRLADLSRVWVIAEVPEAQVRTVTPGAPVKVTAAGLAEPATGKVDAILPDVNTTTRTIKVRIVLPNPGKRLVPGMFATVRFDGGQDKEALLIPSEAVIRTGERSIVMVDGGKGGFVPTEIRTGREADGKVEVLQGLQAGQKVVTSGQFLIDSEASLRGTTERMTTPSATSAPAAATNEHEGTARIESVNGDGLTLSHGPIPALHWGAMTMDFASPPNGLPKGLKPGDRVRFRFHLDKDGMAVLSSVEPAGDAGGKP